MALKTLPAIRASAGIEAEYKRRLDRLIDEMHRSILWWVRAAYKANPPELALDASPAMQLRELMKRLTRHWTKRFDKAAPELAKYFTTAINKRTDAQLKTVLKKVGISVDFKLTAAMNDALQATLGGNVELISNIPEKYLSDITGAVMRSVQQGGDLATLTQHLEKTYQMTRRRASLIARDQNQKATATITRVRQKQAGITHAVWCHSHGGEVPRQEHLNWGNKKAIYEIEKGMYSEVDGEYVWPGTPINCKCFCKPVIPGIPIR